VAHNLPAHVKVSDAHSRDREAADDAEPFDEGRSKVSAEWRGPGAKRRTRQAFTWSGFLWSLIFPQRKHQIFPTASGVVLIALSMGIGTAAYNSSNNILFIALSLLLACLILSGALSWLNLMGVAWRLQLSPPLRVGQQAVVGLELRNAKRFLPTYGLWFGLSARSVEAGEPPKAESTFTARGLNVRAVFAKAEEVDSRGRLVLRERLDPRGEMRLEWTVKPVRRGELEVKLENVGSLFPFGFLKKQLAGDLRAAVVVWPAPVEYRRFPVNLTRRAESGVRAPRPGTGGDLVALRRYAPGDSHRLIHWKATARTRQLLVQQFSTEQSEGFSLWLNTDPSVWIRPEQFELLISFVATMAEDLFRAGRLDAVALNAEALRAVRRVRDVELFLDQLAVVRPVEAPGPGEAVIHQGRLPTGESNPPSRIGGKNLLTFAPDGARGVAAYVDGNKIASA
jgi:uncharacterized protein (DUF58 family)